MYAIEWLNVAPTRPADAQDPNDPAYDWTGLDTAFTAAALAGIEIVPEVYATPPWANGDQPSQVGPVDPHDYSAFLVAMARRYPQIRRWIIWGEPSRSQQWQPQGRQGAQQYAVLLDAAYAGIKTVAPRDLVIGGNTQPTGLDTSGSTSPASWLRWMVLPNGRRPRFDLWGHNPFTSRAIDLGLKPANPHTFDFDDLDTLAAELDKYYPSRHIRLFLSETGTPTDHGNHDWFYFASRQEQAERTAAVFRSIQHFPRIAAISNYLLVDQRGPDGWTTGLVGTDGKRKPAWYVFRRYCS